jgi:hypothetical protein
MSAPKVRNRREIVSEYNSSIAGLLSKVIRAVRDELVKSELDRFRKRIFTLNSASDGEFVISNMGVFFSRYRDQIEKRDIEEFLKADPVAECGKVGIRVDDKAQQFINLFNGIKQSVRSMSPEEQRVYVNEVYKLYGLYLEYLLAGGS